MADSKLKLTYFNIKGLGEPIRYIFAYADVDFEDKRISQADWPSLREFYTYRKLPVLDVDGHHINQSVAIARFLGKKYGLVNNDPYSDALLEAVVDNIRDINIKFKEATQLKSLEARKEAEEALHFYLKIIEKIASKGCFYGTKVTWVEIYCAGYFDTVESILGNFLKPYPNLSFLVERIRTKESVKRYIMSRPKPEA